MGLNRLRNTTTKHNSYTVHVTKCVARMQSWQWIHLHVIVLHLPVVQLLVDYQYITVNIFNEAFQNARQKLFFKLNSAFAVMVLFNYIVIKHFRATEWSPKCHYPACFIHCSSASCFMSCWVMIITHSTIRCVKFGEHS